MLQRLPWRSHLSRSRVARPEFCRATTQAKAKGKGSKKGVSALSGLLKKKAEAEAPSLEDAGLQSRASPEQFAHADIRGLLFALANSYYKATKQTLLDGVDLENLPAAIYHAPFALLAHNRFQEGVEDPTFIYANRAALELWETNWDTLIGMPSRLSASEDPSTQKNREELLDAAAVSSSGFIQNYEGWRISLAGRRFKIRGVTLFNILDFTGDKIGQAAVFREYELEDGTVVEVKADPWQAPEIVLPPTEADLESARAAVEELALYVRTLKEVQGLTNQDPEVLEAVTELKARKAQVELIQKEIDAFAAAAAASFDDE